MAEPHLTLSIPRGAESYVPAAIAIVDKYINKEMNGIDIGSGGAPIFVNTISMDRKNGHWSELVQLHGDAKSLYWFKDGVMDYVFSSHCFEDFLEEEKPSVLKEWVRIIRPGGFLILLLPDERKYRDYCAARNTKPNGAHKDPDFSMDKVSKIVSTHTPNLIELERGEVSAYSFIMVYQVR
jgi:predicted SAM-dependent methyltransferase